MWPLILPGNTIRLNKNTPCARTGVCSDCDSPDRICRVTVILDRKPSRSDIEAKGPDPRFWGRALQKWKAGGVRVLR